MPSRFPFGRDRYRYIDGARYQTASGLSLRPFPGETSALFVQRVDHIARESTKLPDVTLVEVEYEWHKSALVLCLIMIHHGPILAPIEQDDCPIGGRLFPRGRRGKRAA